MKMKMRILPWLVGLLVLGAGIAAMRTNQSGRVDPDRERAAPDIQEPARPSRPFTLALDSDESLAFVWIGPMKMWVGKYEVSNGQFRRYDAAHDSTNITGREMDADIQPAVHVSWEDANNYCGWLNRHHGALVPTNVVFRLPTEQEWEAYARCGDGRKYPWGNQWPPPDDYNYRGTEGSGILYSIFQREKFIRGHDDGYVVSTPITNSGVNTWGLYGVGGNVWEWCANWADTNKETRAIRGGAWNNEDEKILRISHRAGAPPDKDNEFVGFRVVIGPPLKEQ